MARKPPPERDLSPAEMPLDPADPATHDPWTLLAANLRIAREAAGLTQAELARRAGISRTLIRAIEAVEQNVTRRTVDRLAKAVGRTPRQLLCNKP